MQGDDQLYKLKMIFRAYDPKRKNVIDSKSVLSLDKYTSHYWTSEEKKQIRQTESWTFPQLYEKIFRKPCRNDFEANAYNRDSPPNS